jgi:hypothetical protein
LGVNGVDAAADAVPVDQVLGTKEGPAEARAVPDAAFGEEGKWEVVQGGNVTGRQPATALDKPVLSHRLPPERVNITASSQQSPNGN